MKMMTQSNAPREGGIIRLNGERYVVRYAKRNHRRWIYDWSCSPSQVWNESMTSSSLIVIPNREYRTDWRRSSNTLRRAYELGAPPRSLNCDIAQWVEYEGRYVGYVYGTRSVYAGERETGEYYEYDGEMWPRTEGVWETQTGWFPVERGLLFPDGDPDFAPEQYIIACLAWEDSEV